MTDTDVAWLRGLAEKGGKGVVNNIDARSLGRIADEIEQLRTCNEPEDDAMRQELHDYRKRVAMTENCPVDQCEKRLLFDEIERLREQNEILQKLVEEYKARTIEVVRAD